MPVPTSKFHSTPPLSRVPQPVAARGQEGSRGSAIPRTVATITFYEAQTPANLNAEAGVLLSGFGTALQLYAPPPVRAGCRPKLWEVSAGTYGCPLLTRADKFGQRRFCPDADNTPPPGRYILVPVAGFCDRFGLLPL